MSFSGPLSSSDSSTITNAASEPPATAQPTAVQENGVAQAAGGTMPATVKEGGAQDATEHGGRDGLDPTRFGDWEKGGRCIDF
jgi:hypothetical protein